MASVLNLSISKHIVMLGTVKPVLSSYLREAQKVAA